MRPEAVRALPSQQLLFGLLAGAAALFAALLVALTPAAPVLAVIAVVGLLAMAFAFFRPIETVMLGVLAIPLEGFFPGLVGPSQAVLGLAALGWVVGWATSGAAVPRHPALLAFALLVVAQMAGLLFAPEPFNVIRQVFTWGTLFVVAVALVHTATLPQLRWVLLALVVSGGILGFIAIVDPQPLTNPTFEGGDVSRATGGLGSPNSLGMVLGMLLPIQIVTALQERGWRRILAGAAALLALSGMSLAVSRGAFLGLGVAIVVLAFWPPFRRAALIVVPLVAVLALVGHNPASGIVDGGTLIQRLDDSSTNGSQNPRIILWRAAPRMIADRPIFGMGALEYGHYTGSYGILATQGVVSHAHSLVLTVAIESGLVGLTGLLGIFVALGVALRRLMRRVSDWRHGMAIALLASLVGFFVNGILDYALGAAPVAAAFFVVCGCAAGLTRRGAVAAAGG